MIFLLHVAPLTPSSVSHVHRPVLSLQEQRVKMRAVDRQVREGSAMEGI